MRIVLGIIAELQKIGKELEPKLELYYLKNQDCNYVAGTLNSIFARVLVGVGGNTIPAGARNVQSNLLTGLTGAPSQTQNVYCVALPRFNAILIAGPKGRFEDILKEVARLDIPNSGELTRQIFLKNQSAQIIKIQLEQWWGQRFPGEPASANQFRVQFDFKTNSLIIQGSKTDLDDAAKLIEMLDNSTSKAVNEVRIFKLRNAYADELGRTIVDSLTSNLVNPIAQQQQQGTPSQGATGGIQAALGQVGGQQLGQALGGQQLGQLGLQLGQQGQFGLGQQQQGGAAAPIQAVIPQLGQSAAGGMATKVSSIRFYSNDGKIYESGHLADVHVIVNTRTNALVIAAPPETMKLVEKLIDNLDTVSAGQSTASLITQAFTGQGRTATTGQQQGAQQAFGQQGANQGLGAQTTARPLITISGDVSNGATLVDLRITVDDRTNSLVVAGSENDLLTIKSLIGKLESIETPTRVREVIKLRHQAAADVQSALNTFLQASITVFSGAQFLTAYQNLQRTVTLTPESVSNNIIVEATPQYMAEVRRLVAILDVPPPQVMIQVTIAEVQLANAQEMGVETGLQSRVLFNRNIGTQIGTAGVNNSTPGFNFNTTTPLPNAVVDPGLVGFQGLGNLGVGRASATQGVGGFVFSAAGESFTLLARALQAQGRIEVLSRPMVQVTDNQTGYVQVGQDFPYLSTANATVGVTTQNIDYRSIGVVMRVTPRVSADGKVLMRVEPQVSSVTPSAIQLGNGLQSPAFNVQTVQTTVLASDGETIVLGGLISKQDNRQENGIPFFKNIPYVGALFRYRTQAVQKRELIIIMTPHIIRSEFDQARMLTEEMRRLNLCIPDIAKLHGHGMEVIGPAMKGANPVPVPTHHGYPAGPAYFGPLGGDANPGMLVVPQATAPQTSPQTGIVIQQGTPGLVGAQPPVVYQPTPQPMPVPVQQQPPVIMPIPAPGFAPPPSTPVMAAPPPNYNYVVTPIAATGPVAPPMSMAPPAPVAGGPMMPVSPAYGTPPQTAPRRGYTMSPTPEAQGAPPSTKPTEGNQWQSGR
jgi:general secretion pathway protein D